MCREPRDRLDLVRLFVLGSPGQVQHARVRNSRVEFVAAVYVLKMELIMDPKTALELSNQYGVAAVILFIVVFYLGGLIYYVLKQNREREKEQNLLNAKREERLALLIEVHLAAMETKVNERHVQNQAAMAVLSEADRRQREEHEMMLRIQKEIEQQNTYTAKILERIMNTLKIHDGKAA